MFVHEPSRETFNELMVALKKNPPTPFAEQDFLNMFFQKQYSPIPLVYNLVLAMLWRHPENVELEKVKVVHYCATGSKPWRYTGKEENMDREDIKMLVKRWWDIYNDNTLECPSSGLLMSAATKELCTDLSTNITIRTELSNTTAKPEKAVVPVPPAA